MAASQGQQDRPESAATRSPARARPTAAISISRRRPTSKATTTSPPCSARPRKARPATRTAISNISKRSAIRRPASRSATTDLNLKASIAGETHEYTDMYPGMAQDRARGRLRRDRRLVRDPRQGREEPRRPLPEGARHARASKSSHCPPRIAGEVRAKRCERSVRTMASAAPPPLRGPPLPQRGGQGCRMITAKAASTRRRAIRSRGRIRTSPIRRKLDAEMRRVFDICHGCRRCFNLCDSFPRLFDLIDASRPTKCMA